MQTQGEIGFDGKMLRKAMARKTVDYNPSIIRYLEVRINRSVFKSKISFFYHRIQFGNEISTMDDNYNPMFSIFPM